jgi:hypothetical protein
MSSIWSQILINLLGKFSSYFFIEFSYSSNTWTSVAKFVLLDVMHAKGCFWFPSLGMQIIAIQMKFKLISQPWNNPTPKR